MHISALSWKWHVCEGGGGLFCKLDSSALTWWQICMCHFFVMWWMGDRSNPFISSKGSRDGFFFFLILFVVFHNFNVFFMLFNQTHYLCEVSSETYYCLFCTENLLISPSNCGTLDRLLLRTWILRWILLAVNSLAETKDKKKKNICGSSSFRYCSLPESIFAEKREN